MHIEIYKRFTILVLNSSIYVHLCNEKIFLSVASVPLGLVQSGSRILKLAGVRKWGKTKGEGGAWSGDSSCFMAGDISEQYQSQIHRPLQH
jgi:hypothetical protein